jgi:transposase
VIEPLHPPPPQPGPKARLPAVEIRPALTGILFVLKSGLRWEMLPHDMGCGSGMTCWRRLRDWKAVDVWIRVQAELLARMRGAGLIDWSRASVDSCAVRAKRGPGTGPNPVDWGKAGTKRHLLVDGQGTPLGLTLTPPIAMARPNSGPCSMQPLRFAASLGRRAAGRTSCTATRATITVTAEGTATNAGSSHASLVWHRVERPSWPTSLVGQADPCLVRRLPLRAARRHPFRPQPPGHVPHHTPPVASVVLVPLT